MNQNTISVTGERMVPGFSSKRNEEDHVARYMFAEEYVSQKKVLDIACGTGFGSHMLAEAGAAKVVGVDISQEAIDYAQSNYDRDNIEFLVGDAATLPFEDGIFDTIVSFETIEHLPEEKRSSYLDELYRVLRPEGRLLISTPNKLITSPWSSQPSNRHHVLEFTRGSFRQELVNKKFSVVHLWGQRLVHRLLAVRLVRLLEVLRCRILGTTSKRYFEANGPQVMNIPKFHTARYFVAIAKK